jgi:hypothetical protein
MDECAGSLHLIDGRRTTGSCQAAAVDPARAARPPPHPSRSVALEAANAWREVAAAREEQGVHGHGQVPGGARQGGAAARREARPLSSGACRCEGDGARRLL